MKLSEAIRAGASKRPQAFGQYFIISDFDDPITSCAIGAAYEGNGGSPTDNLWCRRLMDETFPELLQRVTLPTPYHDSTDLHSGIARLNDKYRWSREAIADWLESINL